MSDQIAMFSPEDLPDQPQLVEAAKEYRHTGKITRKNDLLVEEMIKLHALGVSDATISRRLHVSRNTVAAILRPEHQEDKLEMSQKMEQVKERATSKLMELVALSVDNLIERVADRKVPDIVLNAIMGTGLDKIAGLTGQATQVIQVKRGPDQDDVLAYIQSLKAAAGTVTVDNESTGLPQETQQITASGSEVANLVANPAPPAQVTIQLDSDAQVTPAPTQVVDSQQDDPTPRGGGSPRGPGATTTNTLSHPPE